MVSAARRDDGDDGGRQRRAVHARGAAGRRVRAARAHERVRRLAAAARARRRVARHLPSCSCVAWTASVATTGTGPVEARPIVAAGFGLPAGRTRRRQRRHGADHPHSETAWRLRHIKRSILKDRSTAVLAEGETPLPGASRCSAARSRRGILAASIFTGLPFSGEVNLLTTAAAALGRSLLRRGRCRAASPTSRSERTRPAASGRCARR